MHVLVNPTWRCQLKCPYCLLPHIKINRTAKEHNWLEWAEGLVDNLTPGSIVDVAGGDPLLFDGLEMMLEYLHQHGMRWAITTNAISTIGTLELLRVKPSGCVMINVSDHPGNASATDNINRLRQHYHVVFNRVDHADAGHNRNAISSIIPYQSWREGTELDGIKRWCSSGIDHWVADPAGDVFLCNPAMATGKRPIGNLWTGINKPEREFICDWGCSSCYTSVPDAWPVRQRLA